MADVYKLREVFSRGMPTVTYVRREHLGLERDLRRAVEQGHAIIAITGPSNCGKTVLRRTVIPDNVVVHVEGGQISDESDFRDTIRDHLRAPTGTTEGASKQAGGTSEVSGSVGPRFAKFGAKHSEQSNVSHAETRNFTGPQKSNLLKRIQDDHDVLVVDDFHYITRDVRATIVRSLKSAGFDGITVVMLSVPYRAFDVLSAEAEMEGRFTHLPIPAWNVDDLCKIARQGFPAMGLHVSDDIQERLATESLGSPLLMQSLCSQLCAEIDVFTTQQPPRSVQPDEVDLEHLFRIVARNFGLPAFKKLAA